MDILIDVGGSSIRIKRFIDGILESSTESFGASSREEFYEHVRHAVEKGNPSERIGGIAISLAGEYDYENETVVSCFFNHYLKGNLKGDLKEKFGCKDVYIVNDGDAHALAYKDFYDRQGKESGGAVNLSLGTAVGFGLLDRRGNLLHNCEGHNWEIGCWQLETDAPDKHLYSALGTPGLQDLEGKHSSPECYILYGQRLCHFLARDLVPVFHPKFIGVSGGIVSAHKKEISEGIDRECEAHGLRIPDQPLHEVQIDLLPGDDYVIQGLVRLLTKKREWKRAFGH